MFMALRNKSAYPQICFDLLSYMKENLPDYLTYHSIDHILDVANVCDHYIKYYEIDEAHSKLIRIAAISHDLGFVASPKDHEERSIVEIRPLLIDILEEAEIEIVSGLIRATKVPQQPKTFFEEVLADADLDYLGRDDYDKLSHGLYKELMHYEVITTKEEWLNVQINFLEIHQYHTTYAKEHRSEKKLAKLRELNGQRLKLKC